MYSKSSPNVVRLYQPALYSGGTSKVYSMEDSFCGGSTVEAVPSCSSCQTPMHLLIQLHVPKSTENATNSKTLQIFACNQASCYNSYVTSSDAVFVPGNGVVTCRRCPVDSDTSTITKPTTTPTPNAWSDDAEPPKKSSIDDNDWTTGTDSMDTDNQMEDIEAKLAAMETNSNNDKASTASRSTGPNIKNNTKKSVSNNSRSTTAFPAYALHSIREPPSLVVGDDDDVGICSNTNDNAKIQAMLNKYLQEMEQENGDDDNDADFVALLKSQQNGSSASASTALGLRNCANDDDDDDLDNTDTTAMQRFTSRIQRCPRQVVRHAPGGMPLWSAAKYVWCWFVFCCLYVCIGFVYSDRRTAFSLYALQTYYNQNEKE